MKKNVASQKWRVFAYGLPDHASPGEPITGDAAQISAKISKDGAALSALGDAAPVELEDGFYEFDLTQAETNAHDLLLSPESSTAEVQVIGVPGNIVTTAQYFSELGVESDGDLTKVNLCAQTTLVDQCTLADTVTDVTNEVSANMTSISGDTPAADNLEAMYDGTGYVDGTAPSSRDQVGNIASGSAAINAVTILAPNGFVITTGTNEVNDEDSTHEEDATYHSLDDVGNAIDAHYLFNIGGNGAPVSVSWHGYAQGNNKAFAVYAWNYSLGTPAWEQIGTITGSTLATHQTVAFDLTSGQVGTGANIGEVKFRFATADGATFATDRILCSYAVVAQSVGYADGAIWVDSAGTAGAEVYVNGTADNPCPWANALTINATLGLNKFHIASGVTVTLAAAATNYSLYGEGLWVLALGGQSIAGAFFTKASVSGTATGANAIFERCAIQANASIANCRFDKCGFNTPSGSPFVSNAAGQFVFVDCFSLVAGSGTPYFDFTGEGTTVGINNRRWAGGFHCTMDSDCVLSHEVVVGGGCTIITGGGDAEIRGITRSLTATMSAAETVQFDGITGPIILSGTTTATVNLYGVSSSLSDTTSAATVNDLTTRGPDVAAILVDTGTTIPTTLGTPADTDIATDIANVDANVDSILTDTAEIGAAGAGLTDLGGMSVGMKAEVQVEADDALVANHLDHFFKVAFNAAAEPGDADSWINFVTQDNGSGKPQFTVDALEKGPSGGAASDRYEVMGDLVQDEGGAVRWCAWLEHNGQPQTTATNCRTDSWQFNGDGTITTLGTDQDVVNPDAHGTFNGSISPALEPGIEYKMRIIIEFDSTDYVGFLPFKLPVRATS